MTTHRPFRLPISFLALMLGMILTLQAAGSQSATPQVRIIDIDGTITPAMASYVNRTMRSAQRDQVAAIVLRINTPGGLSTAMDDIVDDILQSDVPVIAWVGPTNARAASAGVYITYATHIAAMAPGTNIGSASPIQLNGEDQTGETTAERKAMNDAVARIENLAELRHRNVDWAISAVRDADNITADKALELGVINLLAPDIPTLLHDVDGTQVQLANGNTVTLHTDGAETSTASMNLFEDFLQLISDPTIAYLLLSFGGLGIFLELSNPGQFVPGIIGIVCFILGFYALGTLPVNWTGALLIGLGFGLFFLDIFVSSFGLLLMAGLVSFIVGSYMLVDDTVPGYGTVSRPVIWTAAALILVSALLIGTLMLRTLRSKPKTGKSALVGQVAIVRKTLAPTGMVFVDGELWAATAEGLDAGTSIPTGAFVEVLGVRGLQLTVRSTERQPNDNLLAASRTVIPVS
ncbi:MAG TPA: nodulation protein NfeD [Thermomicrobiales bacterium]|nr:nodulation protein NfeD [Thermomicrobiales bacterium]